MGRFPWTIYWTFWRSRWRRILFIRIRWCLIYFIITMAWWNFRSC